VSTGTSKTAFGIELISNVEPFLLINSPSTFPKVGFCNFKSDFLNLHTAIWPSCGKSLATNFDVLFEFEESVVLVVVGANVVELVVESDVLLVVDVVIGTDVVI